MVLSYHKPLWHGEDNSLGTMKGAEMRDEKTTFKHEPKLENPWGQRKIRKGGKLLLQRHYWCTDDLQC